jgi:hypothetical protein
VLITVKWRARHLNFRFAAAAWSTMGLVAIASPANAAPTVLDFEGLLDLELVQGFYDGTGGSKGSVYGKDLGISFSGNVISLKDIDAGGRSGDFGGEPSPDNIIFFRDGSAATMNVADGFRDGFSLFYSAVVAAGSPPSNRGQVKLFEGLDGQGSLLAQFDLPSTPSFGAPDPNGEFSPFVPIGTTFQGLARSVLLEGQARTIGFDNLTLGSATPLSGIFEPDIPDIPDDMSPINPDQPPRKVPEPGGLIALGALGVWMLKRRLPFNHP